MMNIALINPRLKARSPNMWVPLGLAYIAAILEQEGHPVEIIDMNAERISQKELQRRVKDASIVGITGMITEYQEVLRLTNIAKEAKQDIKVVLGGPLATTLPQELLQLSQADFIVIGEGEKTILKLVSAIKYGDGFSSIGGIAYREGDQIVVTKPAEPIANLDTIPFPARHLLNMKQYLQNHFESFGFEIKDFKKIKSTNLITSRGCPYSCTFCFKGMWGNKWRGRSPENIIQEMELLYRKYGANGFIFNDDTFVLDRKRVFEFCNLLRGKSLDLVWYCNGRVNLMTKELLKAMHDAGCRGISYGIESGNQEILNSMRKNITLDQVREGVKWTKDAGINACGYFMIGMLGENKDTIRQTIAFAKELDLDFYGFSLVTPLPGTELYQAALEKGLIKDITSLKDWNFNVNANLTADCSDDDLAAFQNEVFRKFTLENYGKCYMFNPVFLKKAAKVVLSLQKKREARDLARRASGIIRSYWHKV